MNADAIQMLSVDGQLTDKNLYLYCDNNPVMREDDDGHFWHIVVGAVAGALINGVVTVVANAVQGKPATKGLAMAIISGAVSGALACTGLGVGAMIVGNAALSMAENAVGQVKNGGSFDVADMIFDGVIGGMSGAIGGGGGGTKHLMGLGQQTIKRTFNEFSHHGVKAGLKEAGKAFAYYGKNTVKYYKNYFKGLIKDTFSAAISKTITSDSMKTQYRRWISDFGR